MENSSVSPVSFHTPLLFDAMMRKTYSRGPRFEYVAWRSLITSCQFLFCPSSLYLKWIFSGSTRLRAVNSIRRVWTLAGRRMPGLTAYDLSSAMMDSMWTGGRRLLSGRWAGSKTWTPSKLTNQILPSGDFDTRGLYTLYCGADNLTPSALSKTLV